MPLDGGIHYRLLTGPAATSQEAPRVRGEDRLYPVVPWADGAGGIRVTDPAWPCALPLDSTQRAILTRCEAGGPLETLLGTLGIPPGARREALEKAQTLVDLGVACPLGFGASDP